MFRIVTSTHLCIGLALLLSLPFATTAVAQEQAEKDTPAEATKAMDQEVQDLKQEILELNRDLFLLEEELLFPSNTQVAVFVSMDVGEWFDLDSVTVKLDDKEVASYLYTARELKALHRGGIHRLYLGNLKAGEHELVAIFTGVGPSKRDYKRGATLNFEKGLGPKFIELKISDRLSKQQPEFLVEEWE